MDKFLQKKMLHYRQIMMNLVRAVLAKNQRFQEGNTMKSTLHMDFHGVVKKRSETRMRHLQRTAF